ncbi:MAG TPA: DUF4157 domain-containing protein, partial [Catenuloplanes sp.]
VSDPSDRFEREAVANADRVLAEPSPATAAGATAGPAAPRGAGHGTPAVQRAEVPVREVPVQRAEAPVADVPVQREEAPEAGEEDQEQPAQTYVQREADEEQES